MRSKLIKQKAVAIDDNGKGIIRFDNQTIFVNDLLPDEEGEIKLIYKFDKLKEAKLIKRLNSSPIRCKPKCAYYSKCGGCNLMHINYQAQLEYKRQKVQNLLHKFAHIDFEVSPCLGMEKPFNFRNKIQVPVGKDKSGKIITGFYEENTHQIVPNLDCLVQDIKAKQIILDLKKLMEKYHIEPYNEDTQKGLIRHVIIKTSYHYNQTMVVLVTSQDEFKGRKNLAKELVSLNKDITSVIQNINPRKTNVILGEKERILYGSGKIKDSILGLNFLISSKSFYQTNPIQVEVLYSKAIELAKLKEDQEILDAYSGTGTIGLCASKYVKKVTLVELVKDAYLDGIKNKELNGITNAEFINEDCTKYLVENQNDVHFDVVFMDPPRKGSTPEFLNALKNIKPKTIVYISCNPVTLARDLTYLTDQYELEKVIPVDMFPYTSHVETVACLQLKNISK